MPVYKVKVVTEEECIVEANSQEEAEEKAADSYAFNDFSDPSRYNCSVVEENLDRSQYQEHDSLNLLVPKIMEVPIDVLKKQKVLTLQNLDKFESLGYTREYLLKTLEPDYKKGYTPIDTMSFDKEDAAKVGLKWDGKYCKE
jgi:hypothetical protein